MKLNIYRFNKKMAYYTDDKGKEMHSSIDFIIESQMIEYFNNEDKITLCEKYKELYSDKLVIEEGLFGGYSIYKSTNSSYLSLLRCLFYMCMILSCLLAPREITVLGMKQPGGILLFCLSFLFIDTICQSYGYIAARKTLLINACLMFSSGTLIYLSSLFPAIGNDEEYINVVFGPMIKLCFINGLCSLIADQINAFVFKKIKYITKNKALWLRSITSTTISQFFFTILWISFFKYEKLFNIDTYFFIASNFEIKVLFSFITVPILYIMTKQLAMKIKH